jgi:hypothetical protein
MSQSRRYAAWVGRWLVAAMALAAFGAAAAWSLRVACADYWSQRATVAGTERALATLPEQAVYYARLAALEQADPPRAIAALRRAVALNPLDAPSWIELGLRAEGERDPARAEQCLLRAARADRRYLPRWTLANYYFRRGDGERFWFWAAAAAEMAYGDPTPLFRLCGKVAGEARLIERLKIRDPETRARYLAYLLTGNRLDLIGPAAGRLLEVNREADAPLLLAACDQLLQSNRRDEAVEIWNRLARGRRIPFRELDLAGDDLATNGSFTESPSSLGFDWRLAAAEGISAAREQNPIGLRLMFSGRQAVQVEALAQFAPVQSETEYRLRFRYHTSRIAAGTGLAWRIEDASGAVLNAGKDLSSEQEMEEAIAFRTPPDCRIVRISLVYQRNTGTSRIEGFLVLRKVMLRPFTQPSSGPPRSRIMK